MTIKEKEIALNIMGCVRQCVSELKYYQKAGWLSDTGALESAESALEFINKLMKKK